MIEQFNDFLVKLEKDNVLSGIKICEKMFAAIIMYLTDTELQSFISLVNDLIPSLYPLSTGVSIVEGGVYIIQLLSDAIKDKKWYKREIIALFKLCFYFFFLFRSIEYRVKFLVETNLLKLSSDWVSCVLLSKCSKDIPTEVCLLLTIVFTIHQL